MNDSDSDSGVDLPKITGDDLEELKKYIERREVKPPALKLETKTSLIEPKLIKPVKPVKPVKPIKPIKPVIKKIVIPKINLKYQNQQEREVEKLWHNKRQEEIRNSMNKNKINNNVESDSEHETEDDSDESSTPINKSIITKIDLENLEERIKNVVIQSRPPPPPVASPQGAPSPPNPPPVQSKYKHTWIDAKGFVWHF